MAILILKLTAPNDLKEMTEIIADPCYHFIGVQIKQPLWPLTNYGLLNTKLRSKSA
jgi:hypothetical protein